MIKVYSADNKGLGHAKLNVPKIADAYWEPDTVKYGQKARLTVKTKEALQCKIVVKFSSIDWKEDDYHFNIMDVRYKLTDAEGNHFDGIQYDFTPEIEFLKEGSTVNNKMYADIWLLHPFVENLRVKSWFGQNHHLFDMNNKTAIAPVMMVFDTTTVKCTPKYPDGNYLLKKSGKIILLEKTNDRFEKLVAENGNFVTLENRAVFDGLASTGAESGYNASFVKGSPSDLATVFLFGADNSDVEWRFSRYNEGSGDQYALGTAHKKKLSISTSQMGYDRASEIAFIHSHPGNYATIDDVYFSIGWREMSNDELEFYNRPKGTPYLYGDSDAWKVYYESHKHSGNKNSYVYFPSSKDIYHVREYYHPAHIKNITNHNYDPQTLFWGILNGR